MGNKRVPTETELSILQVLWEAGPSTVHEVQEALEKEPGYTTVLKLLQIMHEKELVEREKEGRAHRYRALLRKEETQEKMLGDFTNKLFGGSIQQLIQRAVTSKKLNQDDLDELGELLESLKSQQQKNKN